MSFKSQGFFGKDASRQTAQLERAAQESSKDASKAHELKTSRPYEEETVQARGGAIYKVDCVSSGKGTLFMLPDPKQNQGKVIKFVALKDTSSPYTTFTVAPSGNYKALGSNESTTFQGRMITVELTASEDDWVQSSRTETP